MKKGGKYVGIASLSTPIPDDLLGKYDVTASKFLFTSNSTQLEKIVSLVEQEKVTIIIDKTFPLDEAKRALEYQKKGTLQRQEYSCDLVKRPVLTTD